MTWGRFFRWLFLVPRNLFIVTFLVAGIGVIAFAAVNPGWITEVANRLFRELMPIIMRLLQLAILVAVAIWMVTAPFKKGGKK